jgi:hypothetical protein
MTSLIMRAAMALGGVLVFVDELVINLPALPIGGSYFAQLGALYFGAKVLSKVIKCFRPTGKKSGVESRYPRRHERGEYSGWAPNWRLV